jgi:hypothetical protein
MKYLLIALLLTACNFGLVDIEDKPKTCYDRNLVVERDTMYIDSIPKDCGTTRVTTPFDRMLKDPFDK